MRSTEIDPWGKPYKIVMGKFRKQAQPANETMKIELLSSILDYLFPDRINNYPAVLQSNDEQVDKITDEELKSTINRMKIVAPGPDGIVASLVTRVVGNVKDILRDTYNNCLKKGHFPTIWKEGRLVLIRKPAKPEDQPSSYRPICVLNEMGKILERIIVQRIEEHLTRTGPDISEDQYGFRKHRSTVDAIIELKQRTKNIIGQEWYAVAISLDISNAFNTVPWDIINEELENKNFPIYLRSIIGNYLKDRTISYSTIEGKIKRKKLSCGVPQGSVLEPTLWNLAYDRILSGAIYQGCSTLCYADDTLLIARGRSRQEATSMAEMGANILIRRIEEIGLKVAMEKTEAVIFALGKERQVCELNLAGRNIKIKSCMKYLGIMVDEKWDMRAHFEYTAEKSVKIINRLGQIMPNTGGPKESRRRLYNTLAHSILLYAAPVWAEELHATKAKKELAKLHAAQKLIGTRVIAGYRTISMIVVFILARILSIETQARILKKVYEKKKEWIEIGRVDGSELQRYYKFLIDDEINK